MSKKIDRTGEKKLLSDGRTAEIVSCKDSDHITVRIEGSPTIINTSYDRFKSDSFLRNFRNKVIVGVNDVETLAKQKNRMDIIEDWDYEKNALHKNYINNIHSGSNTKYWFKCNCCGSSYLKRPSEKFIRPDNRLCQTCNKKKSNFLLRTGYFLLYKKTFS